MEQIDGTGEIREYHAHVYYDAVSRENATKLRASVERQFVVRMGPWRDVAAGPHVTAQYQIAFAHDQFSTLVPFLMLNRIGLTLLVHPLSGRAHDDHTINAMWMGKILPMNTDFFAGRMGIDTADIDRDFAQQHG